MFPLMLDPAGGFASRPAASLSAAQAATMDTLVSLAVTASFCWSVYALLFGGAGRAGMRMPFTFTAPSVLNSPHDGRNFPWCRELSCAACALVRVDRNRIRAGVAVAAGPGKEPALCLA